MFFSSTVYAAHTYFMPHRPKIPDSFLVHHFGIVIAFVLLFTIYFSRGQCGLARRRGKHSHFRGHRVNLRDHGSPEVHGHIWPANGAASVGCHGWSEGLELTIVFVRCCVDRVCRDVGTCQRLRMCKFDRLVNSGSRLLHQLQQYGVPYFE